jgi:6-phosphofructo-2-kinase
MHNTTNRERSISPMTGANVKEQPSTNNKDHQDYSISRQSRSILSKPNNHKSTQLADKSPEIFSNLFTNPHPFTLTNLSESAICTTDDDDDNYSFINNTANTFDNETDDELEDTDTFQSRPLTDTPVLSAIDLDDDSDNNNENNENNDLNQLNNNNNNIINPLDLNSSKESLAHSINNNANINDEKRNQLFKEKYNKLITTSMERIESQETAVITTQSNSNNTSNSNISSSVFDIPCQTVSKNSPNGQSNFAISDKLVVVMIGLPARGKSYLSNKLVRYLNWLQINAKIFNVGSTRRTKSKTLGKSLGPSKVPLPDNNSKNSTSQDASFFSPDNKESINLREEWARETLDSLLDYLLLDDGCIGVFDATNTTVNRRKMVFDTVKERSNGKLRVLYLESICNDEKIIEKNILLKLKGPDYKDMDPKLAKIDFINRLENYKKVYETIQYNEEMNLNFQYIQMIDVGRKIISCNIDGYIASQIVYYFLNFNLNDKLIFITRHGESYDNLKGKIGGDSKLTERGRKYSIALEKFIDEKKNEFNLKMKTMNDNNKITVISSALKRSIQTAESFNNSSKYDIKQLRLLNELGSGKFDGMTYNEISSLYPEEFENRIKNKLTYRYPGIGGESYLDVISRLKPVINEIERSKNHLVLISHRVVCRILMAYFLNLKKDSIGDLDIPLHSVYTFEPKPFGVLWHLWEYDEIHNNFKELDLNNFTSNNLKTVKQVGISFRERKYSVVPTAPFAFNENLSRKSSFRNSFNNNSGSNGGSKTSDLNSIRIAVNEIDRNTSINKSRLPPTRTIPKPTRVRNEFEKERIKRL